MKNLFILRGLPNSGKSTTANLLAPGYVYSADDYWYALMNQTGKTYREVFDIELLPMAHSQCRASVLDAMERHIPSIAVANTNLAAKEYKAYVTMAKTHGYRVHYLLVERGPDHGDNAHDVPEEAIERMVSRFRFVDSRLRDEYA